MLSVLLSSSPVQQRLRAPRSFLLSPPSPVGSRRRCSPLGFSTEAPPVVRLLPTAAWCLVSWILSLRTVSLSSSPSSSLLSSCVVAFVTTTSSSPPAGSNHRRQQQQQQQQQYLQISRLSTTKNPRTGASKRNMSTGALPSFASPSDDEEGKELRRLRRHSRDRCFFPLSEDSHKGSSGRVGVLGGSAVYTGAPYYAGMASLRMGADLSYILTALEAAPSIKSYSPELMVIPVYSAERMDQLVAAAATDNVDKEMETIAETEAAVNAMVRAVEPWLDRLHCLVVGPGLGRCPLVMRAALQIIQVARSKRLALVVDADALFLLTLYPTAVAGYTKAVLTPNAIEYARLVESGVDLTGVTVVRKGRVDVIATGDSASTVLECREPGGLKRSGGIGDILAGTLGTLLAWQVIMHPHDQQEGARLRQHQDEQQAVADSRMACWTACCVVRRATRYAYVRHGRSMTGPDVLAELGSSVRSLESREGDDDSEGE